MDFQEGGFPGFEDEGVLVFKDEDWNFWYFFFFHAYSAYYIYTNDSYWNTSFYYNTLFMIPFSYLC